MCKLAALGRRRRKKEKEALRVPFVLLVVHPSRAQRQLLGQVLEVLVPEAVDADQGTRLGVADVLQQMSISRSSHLESSPASLAESAAGRAGRGATYLHLVEGIL